MILQDSPIIPLGLCEPLACMVAFLRYDNFFTSCMNRNEIGEHSGIRILFVAALQCILAQNQTLAKVNSIVECVLD